jgi:two-component sensor histidine kinase
MSGTDQHSMRVLVIEDNPGDARLIHEMFRQSASHKDAQVVTVDLLEKGLRYLDEQFVDVVLLDLGLPDSDGLETFVAVQQHAPTTPVIVFTGLLDDETAARALRDGAQDYLIKGQIDADRLVRSVRYAIERKHAEEQLRAIMDVQRLLLSELDHRVRNNLASLLSLIDIGARQYDNVNRFADSMRNRVQTMATVHTLLSRSQWTSICLERLLRSLIQPEHFGRVETRGPKIVIPVQQVHAFGMVLHEFITNSIKYGALGSHYGELAITWDIEPPSHHDEMQGSEAVAEEAGPCVMTLEWRESGGPRVQEPRSIGVGSKIIVGLAESELQGSVELSYPPEGVIHRLTAVLDPGRDASATPDEHSQK